MSNFLFTIKLYILAIYGVSNDDVSDVLFTFYAYLGFAVIFLASCRVIQVRKAKGILDYVRYVRVMRASLSVSQEVMVVTDRVIAARLILIAHDDERCVLLRHPHASKDPQGRYCQRRIPS
jgi:hypothetical protein